MKALSFDHSAIADEETGSAKSASCPFMLGYRKHSFARAHALLQTLRTNLGDLATLKELQKLLIQEIVRAEAKVRELKIELMAIKGAPDGAAAGRSSFLEKRIEGYRQCAYIWRCFGDGIAFLYMDKFALKQSFYNTENSNAKQHAGFIAGKSGLANELAMLDSAFEHNIPAVLVDLTNTIRHGDICLMGASDPCLIEVKSSKKLDRRGKKQKRSLEKLHAFYETDKAEGLRGYSDVRRVAYQMPEHTHVDQINECIVEALKEGYAVRQPERGLTYIVISQHGSGLNNIMERLKLKAPWVFFLNEVKSTRAWAPYLPFILTIEAGDHLWNFIRGNLCIFVLIEVDALCQIALDKGYQAEFDRDDEDYPLRVRIPGFDGMPGISRHMLARMGMEFVSPRWVMQASIEMLEGAFEAVKAEHCGVSSA